MIVAICLKILNGTSSTPPSKGVTGHHDVAALYTRQRIGIARFPTSVAQGVEAVKEQIEVLSSRK